MRRVPSTREPAAVAGSAVTGSAVTGSAVAADAVPRRAAPSRWRRWGAFGTAAAVTAALFCAYLRLSGTSAVNSDSSNVMLMAWDMLHGNLVLHNWYMSDVSFYTTELPQYALLESFLGLNPETAHVAAAMTYTLSVLLAVLLARRGESGRAAVIRMVMAAGIMVAPQLNVGVYALDMAVGHIGTSVPLLLTWLLLDRSERKGPRWWVPVLTALLLAWVLVADPLVLVVGVAPLGLVGAIRVLRGVSARDGSRWAERVRAQWYPLSLAGAAIAAFGLARLAGWLLGALGGYVIHPVPFGLRWGQRDILALWRFLQLYGADYRGLTGASFAFAIVHLVSVALVVLSVLLVLRRFLGSSAGSGGDDAAGLTACGGGPEPPRAFGSMPLVDQVLVVAILLNVVLYAVSTTSEQGAHEIAVVAPMGAALAARTLVGRAPGKRRALWGRRVRLAGHWAGVLLLTAYLAGLGYELTQPPVPPENSTLASWLAAHGLRDGLAGYWQASSVTIGSGGRVTIRALSAQTLRPYLWMAKASWYDPGTHRANFIVMDTQPKFANWFTRAAIDKIEGPPARVYRTGPYIILVWDKNLLPTIPMLTPAGTPIPGL